MLKSLIFEEIEKQLALDGYQLFEKVHIKIKDEIPFETSNEYKYEFQKGYEVYFEGWSSGVRIVQGLCNPENGMVMFDFETVGFRKFPQVMRLLQKLCHIDMKDWKTPDYPKPIEKFDGNSIMNYLVQFASHTDGLPYQGKLVLIDPKFRFQPSEDKLKVNSAKYEIVISCYGIEASRITLLRGPNDTAYIKEHPYTELYYEPVTRRNIGKLRDYLSESILEVFDSNHDVQILDIASRVRTN